jgi:hypothetical protein
VSAISGAEGTQMLKVTGNSITTPGTQTGESELGIRKKSPDSKGAHAAVTDRIGFLFAILSSTVMLKCNNASCLDGILSLPIRSFINRVYSRNLCC